MNEDWQRFSSRSPATPDGPDASPNWWYPPPNWPPWCTQARIATSIWPTARWPPMSPNTRSPSMGRFASTSSSAPKTPATKRPGAPKLAGRSFTPPLPELARATSGPLLALIFLGHVLDGLQLRLREVVAHLTGARRGIQRRLRLPLEMRNHLGGKQFGGPLGRGRVGPLVAHLQEAAESAGLIPQALNLGACPFRATDDSGSAVVDDVDHLVELLARPGHLREGRHLLEAV